MHEMHKKKDIKKTVKSAGSPPVAAARPDPAAPDRRGAAHRIVLDALKNVRPDVQAGLGTAYAGFELLLAELLLRGSQDVDNDARRVRDELTDPPTAACFRRWICQWEFDGLVWSVLYNGSRSLTPGALAVLWKPGFVDGKAERVAYVVVKHILVWAVETKTHDKTGAASRLLDAARYRRTVDPSQLRPKRPRGRPRVPVIDGLCLMILRERVFAKVGRTLPAAIEAATKLASKEWSAGASAGAASGSGRRRRRCPTSGRRRSWRRESNRSTATT